MQSLDEPVDIGPTEFRLLRPQMLVCLGALAVLTRTMDEAAPGAETAEVVEFAPHQP